MKESDRAVLALANSHLVAALKELAQPDGKNTAIKCILRAVETIAQLRGSKEAGQC